MCDEEVCVAQNDLGLLDPSASLSRAEIISLASPLLPFSLFLLF